MDDERNSENNEPNNEVLTREALEEGLRVFNLWRPAERVRYSNDFPNFVPNPANTPSLLEDFIEHTAGIALNSLATEEPMPIREANYSWADVCPDPPTEPVHRREATLNQRRVQVPSNTYVSWDIVEQRGDYMSYDVEAARGRVESVQETVNDPSEETVGYVPSAVGNIIDSPMPRRANPRVNTVLEDILGSVERVPDCEENSQPSKKWLLFEKTGIATEINCPDCSRCEQDHPTAVEIGEVKAAALNKNIKTSEKVVAYRCSLCDTIFLLPESAREIDKQFFLAAK